MVKTEELLKNLRDLRMKILLTKDEQLKEQLKIEAAKVRKEYSTILFEEKMNDRKKGK